MLDIDRDEYGIDIHHIFPRDWCRKNKIDDKVCDAIVNKTPISYKANRMIGGRAPSHYLRQIREHEEAAISVREQEAILASHFIDTAALKADDFQSFYEVRKQSLLKLVEQAMGKSSIIAGDGSLIEDVDSDE